MLIKMTVKEMAALALALQERPGKFLSAVAQDVSKIMDEHLENHEKIVPPPADERKRVEPHIGQLVHLRGTGVRLHIESPVDLNCKCFLLATDGDSALVETADGPVLATIDEIEVVEDAKA